MAATQATGCRLVAADWGGLFVLALPVVVALVQPIRLFSEGAFITYPLDVGSKAATEPAPVAAKEDRSAILVSGSGWACAQEPWPYGCQWRTPTKRVLIRAPRPI
jgi:hypothetical protein